MPRPKKPRFVSDHPAVTVFVPQGTPVSGEVCLSVEEFEAIRLSDVERMDQASAARRIQVSRQTYGRILANARSIVGNALVTGKTLRIEGGTYEIRGRGRCRRRGWASRVSHAGELPAKGTESMSQRDGRWPQRPGPGVGNGRGRCRPQTNGRGRERIRGPRR